MADAENVLPQEEIVEEEETILVDLPEEEITPKGEDADEEVTIKKGDLSRMKRKAIAYDSIKKAKTPVVHKPLQTPKVDAELKKTVDGLAFSEKKRQFAYEHGLSPEETDAVFKINPNPTKEVLDDPFVQGGLAKLRSKSRVENNTPNSPSRSVKPLVFKADATPAERQAAHDAWVKEWQPKR